MNNENLMINFQTILTDLCYTKINPYLRKLIMMVKRSKALYNGKIIGIESIYTIIDGKQINIPGKTEELREMGKRNELFCPCGCRINLRLVAGPERRQHFRILKSTSINTNCSYKEENEGDITPRIVLKCWLDDKLGGTVESRVPICRVDNEERKYEFSFFSKEKKIAVSYYYDLGDVNDEKNNHSGK